MDGRAQVYNENKIQGQNTRIKPLAFENRGIKILIMPYLKSIKVIFLKKYNDAIKCWPKVNGSICTIPKNKKKTLNTFIFKKKNLTPCLRKSREE